MSGIINRMALPALMVAALIILGPTSVSAESGTFTDCLMGCVPGDTACISCCKTLFKKASTDCYDDYVNCTHVCQSQEGTRAVACFRNCQQNCLSCCGDDQAVREFRCPGWMAPKDCPFDCQAWNPVSRRCVGAPKEVCE